MTDPETGADLLCPDCRQFLDEPPGEYCTAEGLHDAGPYTQAEADEFAAKADRIIAAMAASGARTFGDLFTKGTPK